MFLVFFFLTYSIENRKTVVFLQAIFVFVYDNSLSPDVYYTQQLVAQFVFYRDLRPRPIDFVKSRSRYKDDIGHHDLVSI